MVNNFSKTHRFFTCLQLRKNSSSKLYMVDKCTIPHQESILRNSAVLRVISRHFSLPFILGFLVFIQKASSWHPVNVPFSSSKDHNSISKPTWIQNGMSRKKTSCYHWAILLSTFSILYRMVSPGEYGSFERDDSLRKKIRLDTNTNTPYREDEQL